MVYEWQDAPDAEFAVIGDPIHHSLSPIMQTAALRALHMADRYVAIHVPIGQVEDALEHLRERGYRGVNVTLPHKFEALSWCEKVSETARRVGAVNTVRLADKAGTNTDVGGFRATLPAGWHEMRVLLIGAGGSARAVADVLASPRLSIWNRAESKAHELAAIVNSGTNVVSEIDLSNYDLVVNASSASHSGEALSLHWSSSVGVAYDLSYGEGLTPFLTAANESGWKTIDGREMLVEQGAISLEWWLGTPAPRMAMRRALGLNPPPFRKPS